MGRRKRRQTAKYARQFATVAANKLRRFKKHHPDGKGSVPKARKDKSARWKQEVTWF